MARIKFYCDEHIDRSVVKALNLCDADVVTVVDMGMTGRSDEILLAWAHSEKRAVITRDQDFLRLHAQGAAHSGIVFANSFKSVEEIISGTRLVFGAMSADEMIGHVEYI